MPMSNAECIERLEGFLDHQESIESYILEDDARDPEDLREVEKDIEALRRAIRYLERGTLRPPGKTRKEVEEQLG